MYRKIVKIVQKVFIYPTPSFAILLTSDIWYIYHIQWTNTDILLPTEAHTLFIFPPFFTLIPQLWVTETPTQKVLFVLCNKKGWGGAVHGSTESSIAYFQLFFLNYDFNPHDSKRAATSRVSVYIQGSRRYKSKGTKGMLSVPVTLREFCL